MNRRFQVVIWRKGHSPIEIDCKTLAMATKIGRKCLEECKEAGIKVEDAYIRGYFNEDSVQNYVVDYEIK